MVGSTSKSLKPSEDSNKENFAVHGASDHGHESKFHFLN
jgi:hypothetical protein